MSRSPTTESADPDEERAGDVGDVGDAGLLLVAGDGRVTTFPLARGEVVIGRAPECDVAIAHPALSRRHALLRLGPPLSLQDLGSKNGTVVGRKRISSAQPTALGVGESFHIGKFSLVVLRAPHMSARSTRASADALRVIDPTLEHATSLVQDIARSGVSTLILGETGVGKEVLADTLHQLSQRTGAFVRVNCAALAPALFESELFGHEKGAFTGAAQTRVGLLEAGQGGTVFLDEVGELPQAAQAKLLRAIESKEITRVGGVKAIKLDVRFVAATNRDLAGDVERGLFRSDLFFRIDGVTLVLPPLRERREQIAPLALGFLRDAHARHGGRAPLRLAHDVLARLEAHAWPGNVRELKAVLERAVLLARGGEISLKHLALVEMRSAGTAAAEPVLSDREATERQRIVDALDACAGNQTRAAKRLGISRGTLVVKLARYRIPRPRR